MSIDMQRAWKNLWERLGAEDPPISFDLIRGIYSGKKRSYHTFAHIEHCMEEYVPVRALHVMLPMRPDPLELGIWTHDSIYDPLRHDNEERSAKFACVLVRKAKLPAELGDYTATLIRATKHHMLPLSRDAQLIVDIDLTIFGQSHERYDEYARQVREEYRHVPDEQFRAGRKQVLQGFLDRKRLYLTSYFHDKYEVSARVNLKREIAKLAYPLAEVQSIH